MRRTERDRDTGRAAARAARRAQRRRLGQLVRPHRGRVTALAVLSLVGGALEAAFLVGVTRVALAIADGRDTAGVLAGVRMSVTTALAVAGGVLALRLAASLLSVRVSTGLSVDVAAGMRRELAAAFLGASWEVQHDEPAGRLQQLVTTFAANVVNVLAAMTTSLSAALNLGALLLFAVLVDPVATVIVVGALFTLGSVLGPLRQRIKRRARAANDAGLEFSRAVTELGALGLEMQTFGVRDRFVARLGALVDREARARRRVTVLQGALPQVYTALAFGAIVLGLAVAATVGVDELSALGAVMLVMLRALGFGQQLQTAGGNLASSVPGLEQVDEVLTRYRAAPATEGAEVPTAVTPLEFRAVSFSYVPERPVLTGLSFRVERGEVIGVIGPSGAGKSTLVQLMLGVRPPTAGAVLAGGIDLTQVARASWTSRVAFVAQDPLLVTGTVAENIRFFRDGLDDAALRDAAAKANVLADVEAMPDGFDTHLGERGAQVSGGQRQRLSIARALVGRPELLILDEPTSSLDVRSEALVRTTLDGLRGEVTVVVIAHRMSTLEICDRIMVIESGRIAGFDTPAMLRERSDFYRTAIELSGLS